MTTQTVGYIRVSTVDQHTDRQLEGMKLDEVFTDKASGKDTTRPELAKALKHVRKGDTLVVHSMDRLARNLDDLRKIVRDLTDRGVKVQFIKEGLTYTGDDSPMAKMLLSMLGAVAEFERALIRERQREGIAIAKTKGVYKGRKKALSPEQVIEIRRRVAEGEPKASVAKAYGISRETLYQYLKAEGWEKADKQQLEREASERWNQKMSAGLGSGRASIGLDAKTPAREGKPPVINVIARK